MSRSVRSKSNSIELGYSRWDRVSRINKFRLGRSVFAVVPWSRNLEKMAIVVWIDIASNPGLDRYLVRSTASNR